MGAAYPEEARMSKNLSYSKGSLEPAVRELTIPGLLAEAAAEVPDRIALVTGVSGSTTPRQWTL